MILTCSGHSRPRASVADIHGVLADRRVRDQPLEVCTSLLHPQEFQYWFWPPSCGADDPLTPPPQSQLARTAEGVKPLEPIGVKSVVSEIFTWMCYRFCAPIESSAKGVEGAKLFSLAASMGSGKSFLLDHIVKLIMTGDIRPDGVDDDILLAHGAFQPGPTLSRDDLYERATEAIRNAVPLPVTYNSATPFSPDTYDAHIQTGLALRLLHAAYDVPFAELTALLSQFRLPLEAVFQHLRIVFPRRHFFVAVDEVTRFLHEKNAPNPLLQVICDSLLCNADVAVIVASLAAIPVDMSSTTSGRQVKFFQVPRPSSVELAAEVLTVPPFSVCNSQRLDNISTLLMQLNGHWRSISALRKIVHFDSKCADDFTAMFRKLSQDDAVRPSLQHLSNAWPVMRDAILGKSRGATYYNDLGSLEDLSLKGILRNSPTDLGFSAVPEVSPFTMWVFFDSFAVDPEAASVAESMKTMLQLRPTADAFERFDFHACVVIQTLLEDADRHSDLLRFFHVVDNDEHTFVWGPQSSFNVTVPRPTQLVNGGGSEEALVEFLARCVAEKNNEKLVGNVVYFGGSTPAIDLVTFASDDQGGLVIIFRQNKYKSSEGDQKMSIRKTVEAGRKQFESVLQGETSSPVILHACTLRTY